MNAQQADNPTSHGSGGPPTPERLTAIYVRHHVAAAKGGLDLFERAAKGVSDPEARRVLRELASAVAEDRASLLAMMRALEVRRRGWQERIVSWGESAGRLKPNGTLLRRSPLTDVVELEALSAAVGAKELGWRTLRTLAETDGRLDAERLDELIRRAGDQQSRLEPLRVAAVERAMVAP